MAAAPLAWGAEARPAEIEALVDRARAVPAEFAADALIRIAESPKVQDPAWKRELLEDAFRRAAGAQQPWKKRAIGQPPRGTPVDFLNRAFSQDLDAGSLQCRAVRAMLPLDKARARRWFIEIPHPRLKPISCTEGLVYDVSVYYETLGEVAERAFTPAEIAEDQPIDLLTDHLRGLESPVQVAPVARLLSKAKLKRTEREALVANFSAALKELAGDDRSFSFSIRQKGRAGSQIAALVAACKKQEIPVAPLVDAYRSFLVRHMTAARCADDSGDTPPPAVSSAFAVKIDVEPDAVQFFNDTLREDPIRPIAGDETQPAKVEGKAAGLSACESQDCRQLSAQYRALILRPDGTLYSNAEKLMAGWHAHLTEYLAALIEWKQDGGADAGSYFQMKCTDYADLLTLLPNGADRELVMRQFLDFLQQNRYQRENRMEWFLPVGAMIGVLHLDLAGTKNLIRDLRASADPVVALYSELEAIAPRPPGLTLSLI